MSSTEAHIKLVNTLMASDRMWEATIDRFPDAVYIFGADKRLKKINHAGGIVGAGAARISIRSSLLRYAAGSGGG